MTGIGGKQTKVAVMQPYFVPYFPYWQLINCVDTFVILDDVNYKKSSFITRNHININGEPRLLSLEVFGASQNRKINQIQVGENRHRILKSIELAYRRAPFFHVAYPVFERILRDPEPSLSTFLGRQIGEICDFLGISTERRNSSDYRLSGDARGENRIIELCKALKADQYINAIGGTQLYERARFSREGIQLSFLESRSGKYSQLVGTGSAGLSIVDLMMFNHPDALKSTLNDYVLV